MVSRDILAARGVSAEAWKKLLVFPTAKKGKAPTVVYDDEKLNRLADRVSARCLHGREQNTADFRTIRALDLIWNSPFRQVSPTLLSDIADNCKSDEETMGALKMYGFDLDKVLVTEIDPKSKVEKKRLNVPLFFAVTVGLTRGMLTSRKAKLVNDRNAPDFFDYQPAVNTKKNRARCAALKSRMKLMAQQYGYLAVLDQSVHQMLLYGIALMFTQENWHWEEQLRTKKPSKTADPKKKKKNAPDESYVVKEGLRYFTPHPARTFWDRSHPVKTFNTETGCDWAGHWKILQYKELSKNKELWNIDRISTGDTSWWTDNAGFLNIFFNTCAIAAPSKPTDTAVKDREDMMADGGFYGQADEDKSVCVYEYRERLIPSENGLGDYDYPVWARFMCAGDGTIVYAEPLTHQAVIVFKDNGDEKLPNDASMALQLAPFQDQLSNIFSQYILSVKQNLAQVTMIDKNVLSKEDAAKIENLGENFFRGLNIITYDSKERHRQRDNLGASIISHRFPQVDTNALISAVRIVIELAERVLNFSSLEVGQPASHEQSAQEVKLLGGTTTNALKYIGVPVDAAISAWGQQTYEGWMNEGEDDFAAEIPLEVIGDETTLKELGFEFVEEPGPATGTVHVTAKKSRVLDELMTFSLQPNSTDRRADADTARVLVEVARAIGDNPMLAQAVGADQLLDLHNLILKYLHMPVDAPLRNTGMTPDQQAEQNRTQLKQLVDQVKQQFGQDLKAQIIGEVKQGLIPLLQGEEQQNKDLAMIMSLLRLPPVNAQPQDIQAVPPGAGTGAPPLAPAAAGGGFPEMPPGPIPGM